MPLHTYYFNSILLMTSSKCYFRYDVYVSVKVLLFRVYRLVWCAYFKIMWEIL